MCCTREDLEPGNSATHTNGQGLLSGWGSRTRRTRIERLIGVKWKCTDFSRRATTCVWEPAWKAKGWEIDSIGWSRMTLAALLPSSASPSRPARWHFWLKSRGGAILSTSHTSGWDLKFPLHEPTTFVEGPEVRGDPRAGTTWKINDNDIIMIWLWYMYLPCNFDDHFLIYHSRIPLM